MSSDINYCLPRNETNTDLNTENLICFKTESSYHVPGFCTVPVGSAIPYHMYDSYSSSLIRKSVIKGLVIQNNDCTFTLATDLSNHYEWINSVVFGSETEIVGGGSHRRVQVVYNSKNDTKSLFQHKITYLIKANHN